MDATTKNSRMSLSDAVARDAVLPQSGSYEIADTKVNYLRLRVHAGGAKSWLVTKKVAGKPVRVTLGHFSKNGASGGMGYQAAKAQVADIVAKMYAGVDPNLEKLKRKSELVAERDALSWTVVDGFVYYQQDKIETGISKRTAEGYMLTLTRLRESTLNTKPLALLSANDLISYYDFCISSDRRATRNGKTQARLDLAYLRAAYNLCGVRLKLPYPAISPFDGLSDARPGWAKSHARTRIVAQGDGDLARWWSAVDAVCDTKNPAHSTNVIADYLRLALLWGGRKSELLALRWDNVHLEGGYVLLPGADTKSGRDHIIPLTKYAKKILLARREAYTTQGLDGATLTPFVFTSRRRRHGEYVPVVEPKATIKRIAEIAKMPFASHDLRRTFGTLFAELDVSKYAVQQALNHAPDDTASRHYIRKRVSQLLPVYQCFEEKLLAEVGLIKQKPKAITVSDEEYARFLAWKAQEALADGS